MSSADLRLNGLSAKKTSAVDRTSTAGPIDDPNVPPVLAWPNPPRMTALPDHLKISDAPKDLAPIYRALLGVALLPSRLESLFRGLEAHLGFVLSPTARAVVRRQLSLSRPIDETIGAVTIGTPKPAEDGGMRVLIRGNEVWFRVEGNASGRPMLVLPPAWGLSSHAYEAMPLAPVAAGPVVYFDPPGSGRSEAPPEAERTSANLVVSYEALLEALRRDGQIDLGQGFDIVGHSLSTNHALQLLDRNREAVDRVILLGPILDYDPESFVESFNRRAEKRFGADGG